MTVVLRLYQRDAIDRVRACVRNGQRRPLLVAPTGSGKTICSIGVVTAALERGSRVLFLAHRRELIRQPFSKLVRSGVDPQQIGVIMRGVESRPVDMFPPDLDDEDAVWARLARRRPPAPIQIASIDTLRNREKPPADLVVIDEAHRALAKSYVDLVAHYPDAVVLGMTATPLRADNRGLGEMFNALVVVSTYGELVADGFLVEPRVWTVPRLPDLTGVRVKGGDYDAEQLATAVDTGALVGDIVEHWQRHGNGAPTFAFAVGVEHSRHIAQRFIDAGIPAAHVDADTPKPERDDAVRRLRNGELRVLSNVDCFTEGTDVQSVKCIVLARPTKSLRVYLQQVGRGSRPFGELPFVVLDHAGCAVEHGLPQETREWSLDGKRRRSLSAPSAKTCPECFAVVPSSTRLCPGCGHPFTDAAAGREAPEERAGELVELRPLTDDEKLARWDALLAKWEAHNAWAARTRAPNAKPWKPGWVFCKFQELYHCAPPRNRRRAEWTDDLRSRRERYDEQQARQLDAGAA